ncbi:hypothetical protein KEN51_CDS0370 [Pseudomonas phage vB_Pae10145-KEN51]|nr:hypothetical protein [Pseudomonas phage ANB1]
MQTRLYLHPSFRSRVSPISSHLTLHPISRTGAPDTVIVVEPSPIPKWNVTELGC